MSNEDDYLRRQVLREQRLVTFIAAVATGAVAKKNMPARVDLESAAAEIVDFAREIERKSRELFT